MTIAEMIAACTKLVRHQAFYKKYYETFDVVKAETPAQKKEAYRLRYQVFCKENEIYCPEKFDKACMETDRFDKNAEHFLLIHKKLGHAVGTVRLLLPQDKTPLTSFEIQKLCDHPLLQLENRVMGYCEISRLCMSKAFRRREGDGNILPAYFAPEAGTTPTGSNFRRSIPYAPLGLLRAVLESALDHGLGTCLACLEHGQLDVLRRLGFEYRVLGPRLENKADLQPVIFSIKATLDRMNEINPACWDLVTDQGRLQQKADKQFCNDWQDSVFDQTCREMIIQKLL